MEDYSERTTGTRDEHYNLVSVLYHALQSAGTWDHYAMDAEAAARVSGRVQPGGCELPGPLNAGNGSQGWLVDSKREGLERVTGTHENRKPLG